VAAKPNGGSNSRSEDKKCPRWDRHGLDTVSVLWPHQGGTELLSAIERSAVVPFARGLVALDKGPSGARVMAWPTYGTLKLECRLGSLLDGSRESHRLADADELRQVGAAAAAEMVALFGVEPEGRAIEIGRTDLVTERDFTEGAEGLALLRAMRAMVPPGYKSKVHSAADGTVQTVAIVTPRVGKTIFRAYDKGVESGSNGPGERIRFEAQVQRSKAARMGPNAVAGSDLAAAFGRTIEPFMKGDPMTVTSPSGVVDQVAEKLARGELTAARAERLVGAAELLRRYGRAIYDSDHQSARRMRALRDVGIAVDDELPADASIPVSDLLAGALAEWSR
jgi:hypothetical protein